MGRDTIMESPVRLSDILGSAQIGDLAVQSVEMGQVGSFPVGTVISLVNGRAVAATNALVDDLYGILVEERVIANITGERKPAVPIARHGTFKASMLQVAEGSSLGLMAPRLRELGILLEGLAEREAPAFRIRTLSPNTALPGVTNVAVIINCDGSVPNTAIVRLDGVNVVPAGVWIDHATVRFVIADTELTDPRIIKVSIRVPGTPPIDSNQINFQVASEVQVGGF